MELTQELLNRLDALAQKMGTTAEALWPLLVEHARYFALAPFAAAGVSLLLLAFGVPFGVLIFKKLHDRHYNIEMPAAITAVVGIAFLIIFIVSFVAGLTQIPDALVPEAAAIKGLLEAVR